MPWAIANPTQAAQKVNSYIMKIIPGHELKAYKHAKRKSLRVV
jgi:hypothetical protein